MKLFSYILLILLLSNQFPKSDEKIIRMGRPVFNSQVQKVIPEYVDFRDTLMNDTLWTHYDIKGDPVKYSRKITTGVCIDGECRLVRVDLYWNITGRYLGFELPLGEYLSKTEHDPFTDNEYDLLHELLGDPLSALANYSIEELVPSKNTSETEVDAVSSATIAAVLDYIVEGAVYTTYTLWHICHGSTKREIEKRTTETLNSDLIVETLDTKNLKDIVWVLNHISPKIELTPELTERLLAFISGDDVYLAERSLNALKQESLNDRMQLELANVFEKTGFLQKRLIVQKLKECKKLNDSVSQILADELQNLNGSLVKSVLDLFKTHKQNNENILAKVFPLLKHENRFIANQAYVFLQGIENPDKKTLKNIEKYKKKSLS